MRVPDGIQPLTGYREWHAWTDLEGMPVLMSLYRPAIWPRWEAMKASCLKTDLGLWVRGRPAGHRAPDGSCQCGLYAHRFPDFEPVAPNAPHRYVRGLVLGWGKYVLGSLGWRAELARPVAILSSPGLEEWVEHAADLYGLEVATSFPGLRTAA